MKESVSEGTGTLTEKIKEGYEKIKEKYQELTDSNSNKN